MLIFEGGGDEEFEEDWEDEKEARNSPRCLSRSWAFFSVSTLDTHHRLGILARFLQWPFWQISYVFMI